MVEKHVLKMDEKIAEFLGWTTVHNADHEECWATPWGLTYSKRFFTFLSSNGMGILIEESRKQGIYLEFSHLPEGFQGIAWKKEQKPQNNDYIERTQIACTEIVAEPTLAIALVYLQAKGVETEPLLQEYENIIPR